MGWLVAVAGWSNLEAVRKVTVDHFPNSYFPLFRERTVIRGKKRWRDRALFGPYFFIDYVDDWAKCFNLPAISHVLMDSCEGKPAMVDDREIKRLRKREVRGYIPVPESRFRQGDCVSVTEGVLTGLTGSVVSSNSKVTVSAGSLKFIVDEKKLKAVEPG